MSKEIERTTDAKRISLSVEKFIIVAFSIASISATISGIVSEVSSLGDDDVAEKEARVKNDKRLQKEIEDLRTELGNEIYDLRETIKFILENDAIK